MIDDKIFKKIEEESGGGSSSGESSNRERSLGDKKDPNNNSDKPNLDPYADGRYIAEQQFQKMEEELKQVEDKLNHQMQQLTQLDNKILEREGDAVQKRDNDGLDYQHDQIRTLDREFGGVEEEEVDEIDLNNNDHKLEEVSNDLEAEQKKQKKKQSKKNKEEAKDALENAKKSDKSQKNNKSQDKSQAATNSSSNLSFIAKSKTYTDDHGHKILGRLSVAHHGIHNTGHHHIFNHHQDVHQTIQHAVDNHNMHAGSHQQIHEEKVAGNHQHHVQHVAHSSKTQQSNNHQVTVQQSNINQSINSLDGLVNSATLPHNLENVDSNTHYSSGAENYHANMINNQRSNDDNSHQR